MKLKLFMFNEIITEIKKIELSKKLNFWKIKFH